MTIKDALLELSNKYGEEFNWYMLPDTNKMLVSELREELGKNHPIQTENILAVAKCASNDDVLYVIHRDNRKDTYYIFHLTYSKQSSKEFPKYEKFSDILAVKEFIEQTFVKDYM